VDRRRRPVGGAAGDPVGGCLAVVIDGAGLLRESGPVFQAIGVDDGAWARGGFADRADINPTALADQELGGPVPKR
jgi:hypothetical protein